MCMPVNMWVGPCVSSLFAYWHEEKEAIKMNKRFLVIVHLGASNISALKLVWVKIGEFIV